MIEFRPIRDLSAEAIGPLLAASVAEGFRFVGRLVAEWDAGVARFDRPGELLLGGYDGVRLIAVGGVTRDPFSGIHAAGRLRRVYVLPEARRLGVGRRLVRTLETAAARHYRELVLRTDTEVAARFYEALGYGRLTANGTATHRRPLCTTADASAAAT